MRKLSVMLIVIVMSLLVALPITAQEGGQQQPGGPIVVFPELYNRAGDATRAGDYDKAIVDYTLFLLLNPTFSQGYFSRGLNYDLAGERNLAIQDLTRALDYTSPSPEYTASIYFNRANLYLNQNDFNAALADLNASVEAYPEGADSRLVRARLLSLQQRYDDALDDYDTLIELQPDSAINYVERGFIRAQLGEINAALDDYTHAIELNPQDPQFYVERAMLYNVIRNFDSALDDISSAIELNPRNSGFYLMRGSVNTVADNRVEAASDYLQWMLLNRTREFTASSAVTNDQAFVVEMRPGYMYSIPLMAMAGQEVSVTTSSLSQTPLDPLLVILDVNGEPLVADDDSAGNLDAAITDYALPEEGEYTLIISHAAGIEDNPGDIRVLVELSSMAEAEETGESAVSGG